MELVTIKTCRGVESYLWINGALAPVELLTEKFPWSPFKTRFLLAQKKLSESSRSRAAAATTIHATAGVECASSPATPE